MAGLCMLTPECQHAGDNRYAVVFGLASGVNSTLFSAVQMRKVEVLRMQLQFADQIRGLMVYGVANPSGNVLAIRNASA